MTSHKKVSLMARLVNNPSLVKLSYVPPGLSLLAQSFFFFKKLMALMLVVYLKNQCASLSLVDAGSVQPPA